MGILYVAILLAPVLAIIIFWGSKAHFSSTNKKIVFLAFLSGLVLALPVKYLQSISYPAGILKLVSEPLKDQLVFSFLVIAFIEEGCKFLLLRFYLIKPSALLTSVQSATIALLMAMGFATFENCYIVYQNGSSSYSQLMLMSVFAHASFSVIMAFFIRSKSGLFRNILALCIPFLLHGLFLFTLLLKANPENTGLLYKALFFGTLLIIYLTGVILYFRQTRKAISS